MKMRKLLASSVAASVAVTSLATVASAAEPKTFNMGTPNAQFTGEITLAGDINEELGKSITQDEMQVVKLDITSGGSYGDDDAYWQNEATWKKAATITVTGTKQANADAVPVSVTKTYSFKDIVKEGDKVYARIVVLSDAEEVYRAGEFAPAYFDTIDSITFNMGVMGGTVDESTYKALKANGVSHKIGDAIVAKWTKDDAGKTVISTYGENVGTNKTTLATNAKNNAAGLLAYALTHGGYQASTFSFANALKVEGVAWTVNTEYPLLKRTTTLADGVSMGRTDIWLLSSSKGHDSQDRDQGSDKSNQSYVGEDTTEGTFKKAFAGLSTQVADYFNGQTNGTITFEFTTPEATSGDDAWVIGGVPSTQTGLKGLASTTKSTDFALFFNYDQTGSLQAPATVDTASGSVTFDITDALESLDGRTMGVIDNIWYGLNTEVKDGGLYVKTITLAYEEDTAADIDDEEEVDTDEEEDVDTDEEEDVDTDEEEDDADADEDEDAEIDADEDEDDADEDTADEEEDDIDSNGDVIENGSEDDDANPATGVALAVVPALVAAAAAVVSKKRK